MKLKINKWEFEVTDKDWILDNGVCYQCVTLTHSVLCGNWGSKDISTIMSKTQFNKLRKENLIVEWKDCPYKSKFVTNVKIWKFNTNNIQSKGDRYVN